MNVWKLKVEDVFFPTMIDFLNEMVWWQKGQSSDSGVWLDFSDVLITENKDFTGIAVHISPFIRAKKIFAELSAEQRMDVVAEYCKHCGSDNPSCQCWNDEQKQRIMNELETVLEKYFAESRVIYYMTGDAIFNNQYIMWSYCKGERNLITISLGSDNGEVDIMVFTDAEKLKQFIELIIY